MWQNLYSNRFVRIVQNPRQISATVSNQCENENTKKPVINEH